MAKYLLIFHITSNGIQDYSREKIVECDSPEELTRKVASLKEELRNEAKEEMGKYATSDPDDFREPKATASLAQVLPL